MKLRKGHIKETEENLLRRFRVMLVIQVNSEWMNAQCAAQSVNAY
jgi:hypothetical protein